MPRLLASTTRRLALGRTALAAVAAVTAVTALAGVPARAARGDERFIAAMRLYHENRYAAAYGRLMELADAGHTDAARMALLMLRYGPTLYRNQWSASQDQIQYWLALASQRQAALVADGAD